MIEVSGLSKKFGKIKAVDDVSFKVNEGETLVLLGTSGCGKTTTLKMLNRLIAPTSGSIKINGVDITRQPVDELRRGIGYVLQNTGLFPHYTVAENIAMVPGLLKWDKPRIEKRVNVLMEKLHLSADLLNAYPAQLSGGQQQRAGLARALAAGPPVLLMDEPFGALDNVTRTKIQAEFKQLDELKRKTIIMVTHDVQEAFELADCICLMDKGRIMQIGTPAQLLFYPENMFVSDFLQGHRLQLALKTITLANIWDNLPETPAEGNAPVMGTEVSVWQAMEQLKKEGRLINVAGGQNAGLKAINFEQLMAAFYQFKGRGNE